MEMVLAIVLPFVGLVALASLACWLFTIFGDRDRPRIKSYIEKKYPNMMIYEIKHDVMAEDGTALGDVSDYQGRQYRVIGRINKEDVTIKVRTSMVHGVFEDDYDM